MWQKILLNIVRNSIPLYTPITMNVLNTYNFHHSLLYAPYREIKIGSFKVRQLQQQCSYPIMLTGFDIY